MGVFQYYPVRIENDDLVRTQSRFPAAVLWFSSRSTRISFMSGGGRTNEAFLRVTIDPIQADVGGNLADGRDVFWRRR